MKEDRYTIQLSKSAQKFLDKQPDNMAQEILDDIYKLPWQGNIDMIKGKKEKVYRLRTHNVRVIYTVDHGRLIVVVIDIDNRGDVYK
nr:type II toxin-antitoxin system RelE/ParE family toxin [Clostridia bacterium]